MCFTVADALVTALRIASSVLVGDDPTSSTSLYVCADMTSPGRDGNSACRVRADRDRRQAYDELLLFPNEPRHVDGRMCVAPLPLRHVDVDMVAPDHRNGYVGVHGAPRRAAFIGQPEVGIFAAKLGDAGDRTVLDRKLEGAVVDPLRPGRRYDGAHVDVAGLDDPFGRDERPPVFDDRRLHQGQRTITGFRIARSHSTRRSREHGNYDYPSVNMRTAHAHWRSPFLRYTGRHRKQRL